MRDKYIKSIKVDSNNQIIHATLEDGKIENRNEIIRNINSNEYTYWTHDGKDDVWVHNGFIHVYMKSEYTSDDLIEAGVKVEN